MMIDRADWVTIEDYWIGFVDDFNEVVIELYLDLDGWRESLVEGELDCYFLAVALYTGI